MEPFIDPRIKNMLNSEVNSQAKCPLDDDQFCKVANPATASITHMYSPPQIDDVMKRNPNLFSIA